MNVSFYGFAILWLSCAIIGLEYYFETATRRREFSSAGCVVLFDFQPSLSVFCSPSRVYVTVGAAAGETEMFSARSERARTVLYSASCFSEYSEKSSETKSKPPKSAFVVASVDFCSGERAVLRSRSRKTSGSFKNALPES